MAKYFFHLHCPDTHVIDPDGAELDDADAAWEAARRTARSLMRTDAESEVEWLRCSFEVRDEAGEVVFEMPFTEVVTVDDPGSEA